MLFALLLVIALSLLALMPALSRLLARWRFQKLAMSQRIERIDQILPQTQCEQCGYPGCKPYAEAIANNGAEINQCPPGGLLGITQLAALTGRAALPLNPENGLEKTTATVAWIDESMCIGCYKCVLACPVDAIVGANQLMHTVIASECTGCELCIPPCPVDCIVMKPATIATATVETQRLQANHWRTRHQARRQRLQREREDLASARERRRESLASSASDPVAAALARARAKRAAQANQDPSA